MENEEETKEQKNDEEMEKSSSAGGFFFFKENDERLLKGIFSFLCIIHVDYTFFYKHGVNFCEAHYA